MLLYGRQTAAFGCGGRLRSHHTCAYGQHTRSTQDKLHPTRLEQAIETRGGSDVNLFEVDGIKVGMLICYDIQFPELARKLADGGAEIIVVPSLTDIRGYWRVRYCAQARAIENQIFTCVSPLVGNLGIPADRDVERRGKSLVACPIDNRVPHR
jgi:predicted amidohydrolase